MKYENFEEAKKLAERIKELFAIREKISVCSEISFNDNYIRKSFIITKENPDSFETIAMAFKENILQEYDNQITQLKQQFEAL